MFTPTLNPDTLSYHDPNRNLCVFPQPCTHTYTQYMYLYTYIHNTCSYTKLCEYMYVYPYMTRDPLKLDTTPGTREYLSIGLHVHPRVPLNRLTHGDVARRYVTAPGTREYHSIRYPVTREYHSIGSHIHPRVPLNRVTYGDVAHGSLRSLYPCILYTRHVENIRNHIQPMVLIHICIHMSYIHYTEYI